MCCDTKQNIAAALRRLMEEKPLRKISVQDLMECTNMKRQSFYYHFQDIWDVVAWICRKQLAAPLLSSDLEFESWLLLALQLREADRSFYRKIMQSCTGEQISRFAMPILLPRLAEALFGVGDLQQLTEDQCFALDLEAKSTIYHISSFVCSRKEFREDRVASLLHYLCGLHRPLGEAAPSRVG